LRQPKLLSILMGSLASAILSLPSDHNLLLPLTDGISLLDTNLTSTLLHAESRLPSAAPGRRPRPRCKLRYRCCSGERISQCSAKGRLLTRLTDSFTVLQRSKSLSSCACTGKRRTITGRTVRIPDLEGCARSR